MTEPPEPFHIRGFAFACDIVRLYFALISAGRCPPHLCRQVLKSGTSIGANLEEARSAQTRRDKAAKFSIALKEARETHYWLRLLEATKLASSEQLNPLEVEADELIAVLTVTRRKLNTPQVSGTNQPKTGRSG
jgi:four helix bundle protein